MMAAPIFSTAQEVYIGSVAELWEQRSSDEKLAYLDGMCDGLKETGRREIAGWTCSSDLTANKAFRFCGLDRATGSKFVTTFLADKKQSEVDIAAIAAAYNDRTCKENNVTSKIRSIHDRAACFRQYSNMGTATSPEARSKQLQHCNTLQR